MKMKKNKLKYLIRGLILSSIMLALMLSVRVNAAGEDDPQINDSQSYIQEDFLFYDFEKKYLNILFLQNNFGYAASGIVLSDMLFWEPVINYFNNNYEEEEGTEDLILIGCEIVITIEYAGNYYSFTTGFSYSDSSGLYNQYVGNDVAVVLGSQLVDVRTGLKTYTALKNSPLIAFNIAAVELYSRTQGRTAAVPNDITYSYHNETTNTFRGNDINSYLLSTISEQKQAKLITLNGTTQEVFNIGYSDGYTTGLDTGFNNGYDEGYNNGKTESGFGIESIMGSTLASFFSAFWTLASFEIFGIQLWVIPAIMGGVGLIWLVIKFFFK